MENTQFGESPLKQNPAKTDHAFKSQRFSGATGMEGKFMQISQHISLHLNWSQRRLNYARKYLKAIFLLNIARILKIQKDTNSLSFDLVYMKPDNANNVNSNVNLSLSGNKVTITGIQPMLT